MLFAVNILRAWHGDAGQDTSGLTGSVVETCLYSLEPGLATLTISSFTKPAAEGVRGRRVECL